MSEPDEVTLARLGTGAKGKESWTGGTGKTL